MTNFPGGSAKISMFPARGRFAEPGPRNDAVTLDASPAARVAPVATDGWYHEDAVREAEQARKNKPTH